jgi:hypothetical protein
MEIAGGAGHTLLGGVVREAEVPAGRATAQGPHEAVDPVVVRWHLVTDEGASQREGIPLHLAATVRFATPDGEEIEVAAPQDVVPLDEAGCTGA